MGPQAAPGQPEPAGDARGWFSRAELAEIFDVSISQVDRHYALLAPAHAKRDAGGGRFLYRSRAIIDAVVRVAVDDARAASPASGPRDPMGMGVDADAELFGDMAGDSPELEKWRRIRRLREEIKLAEEQKRSVPRDTLQKHLLDLAQVLRRAGENLAKRFGNEALALIRDATDEWLAGCERILATQTDDPDRQQPNPDAAADGGAGGEPAPAPPAGA